MNRLKPLIRQQRFGTLPRRNQIPKSDAEFRYRSVRFVRPPFFTRRRIVALAISGLAVYAYARVLQRYFTISVEIEFADDEEGEGEEGEEKEEYEEEGDEFADEESFFVPLTFPRKLDRVFYKGSDPEWQAFVALTRDRRRYKQMQEDLVHMVFNGCLDNPVLRRHLGDAAQVGKYWLDISFPDGPPQEYVRSGLEFGDGYVAWSQQRISPEQLWRTQRTLWPMATLKGIWATTSVVAGIQYRRALAALGLNSPPDPSAPEEQFRLATALAKKSSAVPVQSPAETSKKLPWLPSLPPTTASDLPIAWHVLNHSMAKSRQMPRMEPPRGTVVVQGLVELRGKRGHVLIDVRGFYDPKVSKYLAVRAQARAAKLWKQSPKGGK